MITMCSRQQHGHKYLLRHVAAGLCTLSSLAPLNAAGDAAAPRNTALAPADTVGSSDGGFAAASDLPSGLPHPAAAETTRPGPGDGGGGARPPSPVASAPSTALVADCARRLALIGRHQVKTETDCASLALCIRGLAGLDLPLPDRAQLALPFVMRLRDPAYFFALRGQPAATLVQLLAALSKLPLYRHVQRSDVARIAQVSARLVASLTPQVALLSSQDACRVTAALVRLGCSPERREAELYRDFMRALAGHISQVLLEEGRLTPDQAVRLLWAYAVVAPPSGGAAAASGGATGLQPTAAPAPAPLGDSARKGAAAAAAAAVTAAAGGEEDVVVRQMVVALLRMACRGLDSHPPLELVKLVFALPRLGVQREADAVLPRVTPRLLAKLESLDLEALADVASSYHRAHSHEPGLLQAIADRVLELEKGSPLSSSSRRVIGQLLACYGPGGSHVDQRLRELLQRTSAQRPAAPGAAALAAAGPSGGGRSLSRRLGVGP
ncbi:hypothetical protein PLESTM_001168700 [Pleodorina starrii]|nr:hypothetical protein PLESTM_001168700 [Pleodorina starrii]